MRTLASELGPHVARTASDARIYVDANMPAGLFTYMRNDLRWDVFFVMEHGDLRRARDGVLDFASTYTPEELRGRGIASAVVRGALEYAREHHCRVVPTCWFVKGYIQRHPEYTGLVAN